VACVLVVPTEIQVHLQPKKLSLDEAAIPWQGGMKFKTYNPGKIKQYGLLVRMVCEAVSGYICAMKTCSRGAEVGDTVLSVCKS